VYFVKIQPNHYYYVVLFLYLIRYRQDREIDARHYEFAFLSFGESGGGRYPRPVFRGVSHPRCRHHSGTPKDRSGNDLEIIYSAGVRGSAAEGGSCPPNSLMKSHDANQLRSNESRARVLLL